MKPLDFSQLRAGAASCPSDLTVDQHVAHELLPAAEAEARGHFAGCASCTARVAERRAKWDAVSSIDSRASLALLRRKLDASANEGFAARLRRRWYAFTPLAAMAAACLFLLARPHAQPAEPEPAPRGTAVRLKGGLALRVWQMTPGGSDEIASGAALRAGDRIRFGVDLPSAGWIRILDIGASGRPEIAWPAGGEAARLPVGLAQILPGALELDRSAAPEHLYVVACSDPAAPARCEARGTQLSCPEECSVAGFLINKAP